jgi:hypothetical protein
MLVNLTLLLGWKTFVSEDAGASIQVALHTPSFFFYFDFDFMYWAPFICFSLVCVVLRRLPVSAGLWLPSCVPVYGCWGGQIDERFSYSAFISC